MRSGVVSYLAASLGCASAAGTHSGSFFSEEHDGSVSAAAAPRAAES